MTVPTAQAAVRTARPGSEVEAARPQSVGRDRDIAAVLALLRGPAVPGVLLFGPPGSGVAHLARLVASAYRADRPEGSRRLAVLDAPVTGHERPAAPPQGEVLLATARSARAAERLGLVPHAVGPLPVPDDCSILAAEDFAAVPSVRLYTETLTALQPGFRLHAGSLAAVAEICAELRGLPGELRLAARFAAMEGHTALRTALRRRRGPEAAALARLAALRTPPARGTASGIGPSGHRLLAHAAVFAGGSGPEALRTVAGMPPEEFPAALRTLLDAQVMAVSDRPSGSLRGLALARLHLPLGTAVAGSGDPAGARLAHARYYARFAGNAARRAAGGDSQAEALIALHAEQQNLRAAAGTLLTAGRADAALRLLADARVHRHATDPFSADAEHLVRLADDGHRVCAPERLRLLLAEARLRDGEREAAAALLEQQGPQSAERLRLTALVRFCSDRAAGTALLRRAAGTLRGEAREPAACRILLDLALAELVTGDLASATDAAHRALLIALGRHDRLSAGGAMLRLAVTAAVDGRETADYVSRAMAHLRPLGGPALLGAFASIAGSHLLPGIAVRAAGVARVLGTFHTFRRASLPEGSGPDLAGCRLEQRLLTLLDEPDLLAALHEGARVPLHGAAAMLAEPYMGAPVGSGPPDGPATAPGGPRALTPRQAQVAQLVATGLSNKQIARRLGISEWTAVNHLREIMRRLECTSRVQVAGWIQARSGGVPAPDDGPGHSSPVTHRS